MFRKLLVLSLVSSLVAGAVPSSQAADYLVNQNNNGDFSDKGDELINIKYTVNRIPSSNPNELQIGIVTDSLISATITKYPKGYFGLNIEKDIVEYTCAYNWSDKANCTFDYWTSALNSELSPIKTKASNKIESRSGRALSCNSQSWYEQETVWFAFDMACLGLKYKIPYYAYASTESNSPYIDFGNFEDFENKYCKLVSPPNCKSTVTSSQSGSTSTKITSFTATLDKVSYKMGDRAVLQILGKDSLGNLIGDGIALGLSKDDVKFDWNPNNFLNSPSFADKSINGGWRYEIVIGEKVGTFSGSIQINSLPTQKLTYLVLGEAQSSGNPDRTQPSADLIKLRTLILKAQNTYDDMMFNFENYAPEIQKKLSRDASWKVFLNLRDDLSQYDSILENNTVTNSEILQNIVAVTQIINKQIYGLQSVLKIVPKYQCENAQTDKKTVVLKNGSCPKRFKKVLVVASN